MRVRIIQSSGWRDRDGTRYECGEVIEELDDARAAKLAHHGIVIPLVNVRTNASAPSPPVARPTKMRPRKAVN